MPYRVSASYGAGPCTASSSTYLLAEPSGVSCDKCRKPRAGVRLLRQRVLDPDLSFAQLDHLDGHVVRSRQVRFGLRAFFLVLALDLVPGLGEHVRGLVANTVELGRIRVLPDEQQLGLAEGP